MAKDDQQEGEVEGNIRPANPIGVSATEVVPFSYHPRTYYVLVTNRHRACMPSGKGGSGRYGIRVKFKLEKSSEVKCSRDRGKGGKKVCHGQGNGVADETDYRRESESETETRKCTSDWR